MAQAEAGGECAGSEVGRGRSWPILWAVAVNLCPLSQRSFQEAALWRAQDSLRLLWKHVWPSRSCSVQGCACGHGCPQLGPEQAHRDWITGEVTLQLHIHTALITSCDVSLPYNLAGTEEHRQVLLILMTTNPPEPGMCPSPQKVSA